MYLYATSAGFEIGRVSRNGSVLSSISSRINAVAFTRVTKIRTTCRNNGIIRFWNRMVSNVTTRAAARESVRIRGTNLLHARRGLGELARLRRLDAHRVRMGVDQRANRMDVARRDCLAIVDQDDVVRDPFDLI